MPLQKLSTPRRFEYPNMAPKRSMKLHRDSPFVLAYEGVCPVLKGPVRRSEFGSSVLGRVTLGREAVLEAFAVLRGDGHVVNVGGEFHLGLHSTVHIAHALYGATIGERVTVGTNSVVHACTVGDDCVIEDGVSVLDGAIIGNGSVVAAGSVVFPRKVLPPGQWCEGLPAVPTRSVDPAELQALHVRMRTNARADSLVAAARSYGSIVFRDDNRGIGLLPPRSQLSHSFAYVRAAPAIPQGPRIGTGPRASLHTIDRGAIRSSEKPLIRRQPRCRFR